MSFLSRGHGYTLFLTPEEAVMALAPGADGCAAPEAVTLALPQRSTGSRLVAGRPLGGRSHYLRRGGSVVDVPHHAEVRYEGILPGIDVVFYGEPRLEFDVEVAPGADASSFRMTWRGADGVTVDGDGRLRLRTRSGEVISHRPIAYQMAEGARRPVEVRYRLLAASGGGAEVGFDVGAYDRGEALVIDPIIAFSTFLGGDGDDGANAVATDAAGNVYVVGHTRSIDFPTASPLQPGQAGNDDAFITKVDANGSGLLFSTYFGGSGDDVATSVAVDAAGDVYVAGRTISTDFPVLNPFQATARGANDAFVAKIVTGGSALVYSSYLGGQRDDRGNGITVNAAGQAIVVGSTRSDDFPVVTPFQSQWMGDEDAFVSKVAAGGGALVYSTYLGGSGSDIAQAVAVSGGTVMVAGGTRSYDFPVAAAYQPLIGGATDAFVAMVDEATVTLPYSTFLGGTADDVAYGIAGSAAAPGIVGSTRSDDFPILNAIQAVKGSFADAFATQMSGGGAGLAWSTFLGGSADDIAYGAAVDATGTLFVGGTTLSSDFPVLDPLQASIAGGTDGFLTRINGAGSALVFSTFLGGTAYDEIKGIAVDTAGYLVATGGTTSDDFPVVNPLQATKRAFGDAFITRLDTACGALTLAPATLPNGTVGVAYAATITATGGTAPYTFAVTAGALPPGLTLSAAGVISGVPTFPGVYGFTVTATDATGRCGSRAYVITIAGATGAAGNILVGQGLGQPNPNRVRIFRQDGTATTTDFLAYAAGAWGVNVAAADPSGTALDQVLTGPGPGDVFGPQVRAFLGDGTAIAKINFFAYGTLKFGVNVNGGSIEADAFDEIETGPGPGGVFGPHVRAFNYDGGAVASIAKVSFYAYSTLKFGVNVSSGDMDGDTPEGILTGAGPGAVFGSTVRAFNYDGGAVAGFSKINFNAFTYAGYGVNVAGGDVDADGFDEIGCSPGPGPTHPSRFAGFNYDGSGVAAIAGFDVTAPTTTFYGGRVGLGEITGDAREELLTGAGRAASADATVRPYLYTGAALGGLLNFNAFPGFFYGVNVDAGAYGF